MTLKESIRFHTEEAGKLELHPEINKFILGIEGYERAKEEHTQTAEWLTELSERRKQPEIVCCGECVNFVERDFCKVAGHNIHRKSNCMKVFGAKRRTDE